MSESLLPETVTAGHEQHLPSWLAAYSPATGGMMPGLRLIGAQEQAQPAIAEARCCTVIFDGVLYNQQELRRQVESISAPPAANDAELILHAYHRWGEGVLQRVKGIFALLIWDGNSEQLLCARDPLGIYPLFYTETHQKLLFSTSIESLIRHPGVDGTINRPALSGYLYHQWPNLEETFFTAIRRVPQGHVLRLNGDALSVQRYWSLPLPGISTDWVRSDELEQFDLLMDQAINRCLMDGPIGLYLSGGLDSVTIAAIVEENSRRKGMPNPLALSLAFPDPTCNEEMVQRAVASHLGLSQIIRPFDEAVGPEGLVSAALELSGAWPAPLQNIWSPAYHSLAREAVQQGYRTIVGGSGGDEWLTVTPVYAADLIRSLDLVRLYHYIINVQRSYRLPRWSLIRNVLWTNGAHLLMEQAVNSALRGSSNQIQAARRFRNMRRVLHNIPDWLAPDPMLRREIEQRAIQHLDRVLQEPVPTSFYFRDMWAFLDHPLTSLEFEEVFESGRRLGLRFQHPFWDVDLVEFLYRVPPHLLNQGGRNKGLVREMLARRFPGLGFERQKKVISLDFFKATVLPQGLPAWHKLGGARALSELGIIHPALLENSMNAAFAENHSGAAHLVWEVLNTEAWLRPRV